MPDDLSLKGAVIDVLSGIKVPGTDQTLLDAHILDKVEVKNAMAIVNLSFSMEFPKDDRWQLEDDVTDAVEAVDGIISAQVRAFLKDADGQVASPTIEPHVEHTPDVDGRAAAAPKAKANTPKTIEGVGRVIAVASGKGGVGKSTIAVNLALALRNLGYSVGLLDIDVYGPSLPTLLGVMDRPNVKERRIIPLEVHGMKLMSLGFLMEEDTPVIWRGPIVTGIIRQFLGDVEWKPLDYLIVDLPPGTGDAQLSLAQAVPVDGAVIVTTPSDLALIDAARGLQMFRTLEIDVLGIVENMAYQVWDGAADMKKALDNIGDAAKDALKVLAQYEKSYVFGKGGGSKEANRLGVPFLGEVPLDGQVREGGDNGKPIVLGQPDGPVTQAFLELAEVVAKARPVERDEEGKAKGRSVFSFLRR